MALVLTRKRGQAIKVSGEALFTIAHASRGVVKVIVEAPAETRIIRSELEVYDAKNKKQQEGGTKDGTSGGKQKHGH